ncbi:hypothetical protein F5X98DRAFT_357140 [Xylaria grammica]|nr:hypothetical protein F5X98DRAFT_357140 [Xylaria grammica]
MMASHVKYQEAPVPKPRRRAGPLLAVVGALSVVYLLLIKPTMKTTWKKISTERYNPFQLVPFTGKRSCPDWILHFVVDTDRRNQIGIIFIFYFSFLWRIVLKNF